MNRKHYEIREEGYGYGKVLILKGAWHDKFTQVILKKNISVLRLSVHGGWRETDISFIKDIPPLRGVEVVSWKVKDVTPLASMPNLEFISVDTFTKGPDFSSFPRLRSLFMKWCSKAASAFACKGLTHFNMDSFPYEDLSELSSMKKLEHLQLFSRKLTSTDGIEQLQALKILELSLCYQLRDVSSVAQCPSLEKIEFNCCKKLYDIAPLAQLPRLNYLIVDDCKKIASIKAFEGNKTLERAYLVGDTNIEDGDLSPLLTMPNLKDTALGSRRHYKPNREEVELHLEGLNAIRQHKEST